MAVALFDLDYIMRPLVLVETLQSKFAKTAFLRCLRLSTQKQDVQFLSHKRRKQ
jgi:hypothetical protein